MVIEENCQGVLLSSILEGFSFLSSWEETALSQVRISDIVYDSRKASHGKLFVCIRGEISDGHRYAQSAYERGCRAFVVEERLPLENDALQLVVPNSRVALSALSRGFFHHPERNLCLIGVTGTKGKTTIANLAAATLNALGISTCCIGTNGVSFRGKTTPGINTTPESYELARIFHEVRQEGAQCVVMEVSSIGVKHHRTDGLVFDIGVFTNLSPDHIGPKEHGSMEEYAACKAQLFAQSRYAVINADDAAAGRMIAAAKEAGALVQTFALREKADWRAENLMPWQSRTRLGIGFDTDGFGEKRRFAVSQPGEFSVYNALAVLAVCRRVLSLRGEPAHPETIGEALSSAAVAGRVELVDALPDATVIIDFAHNALSLKSLLQTLREYRFERLVVVFGSVGGRSRLRRVPLGEVAAEYADFSIITSDNPDFEPPQQIIDEIAAVLAKAGAPYIGIPDRADAVRYAIRTHKPGDMIVFAGKGHENYQLVRGVKEPFSEKEIILRAAAEITAGAAQIR